MASRAPPSSTTAITAARLAGGGSRGAPGQRSPERLAIIGDMLELGDRTLPPPRGRASRRRAATRLIAVGEQAEVVAAAAVAAGMPAAAVAQAADADRAAELAVPLLGPGTVVLVKGAAGSDSTGRAAPAA